MRGLRSLTLVTGLLAMYGGTLTAQSLSPQAGAASADANTTGNVVTFTVTNDYPSRKTFTLQCGYGGQVTACSSFTKVTLNGGASSNVNVTYTTGAAGSGTVTLATFDGLFQADQGTYTITVGTPVSYGVAVTPDGGSLTTASGSSGVTAAFTVQNTGNVVDWFTLACGRTGQVASCSVPGTVGVNAGASATVNVTYATSSVPGTGTVTLTATSQGDPTKSNGGSYTVTVPVVYGVNTTPDGGTKTAWTGSSGNTAAFTVTNTGNASDTYAFSCARTGQVSSCGAPANVTLAAGASTSVTGTFAAGLMGSGTLTVTATSLGNGSIANAGSYNVTVQSAASVMSPTSGSMTVDPNTTGNAATFTVTNTGNVTDSYVFDCTPGAKVTACTPPGVTSIAPGASATVNVTFSTGAGGSGTLSLEATSMATAEASSGSYNVTVRLYQVAVTPDGGSLTTASGSTANATFTVQNTGNVSSTFSFTCGKASPVLTCTNPASVTLGAGASTTRVVTYTTGNAGTGSVTLTASGSGASNQGSFTVTVPVVHGVDMTPSGSGNVTVWAGSTGNAASFTITNTGNATDTFAFNCTRTGEATTCTTPANVTLGSGASTSVTSTFDGSTSSGSGTVTLTAISLGSGSTSSTATTNVTVQTAVPSVVATPSSLTVDPNTSANTAIFTISNTGTASDAFAYECVPGGQVTACSDVGVVTIGSGASTTITVSFTAGAGGSGTVGLDVSSLATAASATETSQVTVRLYAVDVTQDADTLTPPSGATGQPAVFTVQNTGNQTTTFWLTCGSSGIVITCLVPTPASVTLAPGASLTDTVTFTTGPVAGAGSVTLLASGSGASDTGSYAVVAPVTVGAQVTPGANDTVVTVGSSHAFYYQVRNTGNVYTTITLACSASALVTCDWVNPADTLLGVGDSATAWISVTAGNTEGPVTVSLSASAGAAVDTATVSGVVARPNQLVANFGTGDRSLRAGCVTVGGGPNGAIQCGDLVYAHALPGYRTMNRLRNITLLYNSGTAHPVPVVAVDHQTFVGDPVPDLLRVRVLHQATGVELADVYFSTAGISSTAQEVHRMSIPIDAVAAGMGTGSHEVTVELYRKFGATWDPPLTAETRLLVVDRRNSPFGAGWWPAGVEQLVVEADSSATVILGDGSALFYAWVAGGFVAPPGEYATLTRVGSGYRRELPNRRVSVWYGATGLVDSITDNLGNTARYTWNAGVLVSITDPVGYTMTFTAVDGRIASISIPALAAAQLYHTVRAPDGAVDLDSIADPDGFVTRWTYEATTHRMVTSAARAAGAVTYTYDATSRIDSVTAPAASSPAVQYRAWQLVGAGPAYGTTETTPVAPDRASNAVILVSQWRSLPALVVDTARFAVDRFQLPIDIALPEVSSTVIERDSVGQPVHIYRGGGGGDVWQVWDTAGKLIESRTLAVDGTPLVTTYTYDPVWRAVTKITPPIASDSVMFGYDPQTGLRRWTRDAEGNQTDFYYSPQGQLDSIVEPLDGSPIVYSYDPITRNVVAIANGPQTMTYVYDAVNGLDLVTVRDAEGNESRYTYDGIKRVRAVTRTGAFADPSTITYDFDDVNRIRTQTVDPGGVSYVTTWEYDGAGRVIERCERPNWCETTTYGDGRNPTQIVQRDGTWIVQTFDGANRVTSRKLGFYAQDDSIAFGYDGQGNLTAVYNRYARITRRYDTYGRLVYEREEMRTWKDSLPGAEVWRGTEVRHAYDRNGRRAITWIGEPIAWELTCTPIPDQAPCENDGEDRPIFQDSILYAYDTRSNLTLLRITHWAETPGGGGDAWTFQYDGKNRLTDSWVPLNPGSVHIVRGYDDEDRLRSYTSTGGGIGLADSVIWNGVGQAQHTTLWGGNFTNDYSYDGLGRLITISGSHENDSYTYDPAGNRLTSNSTTWAYNSRGQLETTTSGSCTTTYSYDQRGNQTRMDSPSCSTLLSRDMEYDIGGRMIRMVSTKQEASGTRTEERTFWYDGLGRRILMHSTNPLADDYGVWRYFWLEDHVAVKTRNNPDPDFVDLWWPTFARDTTTGDLVGMGEWYFYGAGVDNLLASWGKSYQATEGRRLFFQDWRGSVVKVTDETGVPLGLSPETYMAFGTSAGPGAGSVEETKNPGYNGLEEADGLVYMRNRWYDPNTGRFTQEDPIGYAGGSNLYAYVGNNPVSYTDPFGLDKCKDKDEPECLKKGSEWVNPTGGAVRGCDEKYGCGHFGASRDAGARTHEGTDYVGTAGQQVLAVTSGTVRVGQVYSDNASLRLIAITRTDGTEVKQFYVSPAPGISNGTRVKAGQPVGTLQSLQGRYPGIPDHTHVEIRPPGGPRIDPASLIPSIRP